jgi:cysteine desulfurase
VDYIYLDNEASTRVSGEVLEAMLPYFSEKYGMASSEFGHSYGVEARQAIEKAREVIAKEILAKPEEIFFTSGMAESNNMAIRGTVSAKKGDMVTSTIEQNTVIKPIKFLADHKSVKKTLVPVNRDGYVDMGQLKKSMTKNTSLVSIQHGNQEIGTIQDLKAISELCGNTVLHSDASHSFLKEDINVDKMGVDLLTLSAHSIYGPKGVGALYIREGTEISPLLYGGGEQKGMRPGLENVPAIVGFGKAVEIYDKKDNKKMSSLRDHLISELLKIKETHLNGPKKRLCNNANVTFKYVEGESILLHLDMRRIAVTTGSACFSRELTPSHVISALGMSHADAHGSVRFTLSKDNTKKQMDYVINNADEVVMKLREISSVGK